jgi:hypothetical protein
MFRWIFSQDTEEIAELLVIVIARFRRELKDKGSEALQEIGKQTFVREFGKSASGSEGCSFYLDGKLKEFFFDIIDERKSHESFALIITAEDDRYYGFRLYCNLLTGLVTVRAEDSTLVSMNGKRATRKARKLCKVFAERYRAASMGSIIRTALRPSA